MSEVIDSRMNRATRRRFRFSFGHRFTMAYTKGRLKTGNYRKGCFGNGAPKSIPAVEK